MPVAHIEQIVHFKLVLELTPNEIDLLKAMMRNQWNANESVEESQIRRSIFNACNSQRT